MNSRTKVPTRLAAAALVVAAALASGACRPKCCTRFTPQPAGAPANEVYQEFPSSGTAETAWRVRWAEGPGKGLYITGAWFRRAPGQPWIRVLWDARLSEIFVPYHTGFPRYYDLGGFGFGLENAVPGDAGCCGRLIGSPPRVVWEVRDRGLAWKDHAQVRRGQTLVLWGTINAANYNYVVHYGFRDDGMIEFRIGASAQNLPGRRTEAHMHLGLWRVDVDLGGAANNSVMLMRHVEPTSGPTASDVAAPFNRGVEGSATWNPLEFTELMIENTAQQNGRGHNIAYELMPMRGGSARHQEAFTQADFWVTRYRGTELAYPQIAGYVNGESVTNTDILVWHATPLHHLPRDEDGRTVDGTWQGVALVMWGGFDLRPRNLFDETPLHP
jgi:primary-amine oxidase